MSRGYQYREIVEPLPNKYGGTSYNSTIIYNNGRDYVVFDNYGNVIRSHFERGDFSYDKIRQEIASERSALDFF